MMTGFKAIIILIFYSHPCESFNHYPQTFNPHLRHHHLRPLKGKLHPRASQRIFRATENENADNVEDANGDDDANTDKEDEERNTYGTGVTGKIEEIMRKSKLVEDNYKFGDISKKTIGKTTIGKTISSTLIILDKNGDGKIDAGEIAEAAAEAAKGTIERATGVAEKSVRQVTGDESYKFGDYTNRFLSEGDKALNKIRDEAFSQIPKQVWGEVLGDLTEQQREAFAISLIQLAATAVLAFNLSMNFVLSFTWMRAWKVVVSTTNLSPLSSPSHWSSLIARRASVEALISPLSLPLAAFCTLFILLPYKDLVEALERRMPLKRRFPIMNRVLTLAVACAAVNIGLVATATGGVIWTLNRIYL